MYKFNDDIPAEEAVALIRAVERYANARCETGKINISEVFAILGIEKSRCRRMYGYDKYICKICGSNLDPGEKCDCIAKRKKTEEQYERLLIQEKDGQFTLKELIACT